MRNQAGPDSTFAFRCTLSISALYFLDFISGEPRLLRYACKTTAFKMLTYLPNYQLILGNCWWLAQRQDLLLSTCPKLHQAVVDSGISVQQSPFQGQLFCVSKSRKLESSEHSTAPNCIKRSEILYITLSFPTTCYSSKIKKVNTFTFFIPKGILKLQKTSLK